MKFNVEKGQIIDIIGYTNSFTGIKNLNTIIQNVMIESDSNKIVVKATNYQASFIGEFEANIEEEGAFTVSGKLLYDIIKELPDNKQIFFNYNGNRLDIECGNSLFKLATILPDEFPSITEINAEYMLTMNSKSLVNIFKKILFCISNDTTKIEYNGAHFNISGNMLTISAADYMRIGSANILIDDKYSNEFLINIPKKTVSEIVKVLENIDEDVIIETDKNQIAFTTSSLRIYSKLVERSIKSINKLFEYDYSTEIKLNKKSFVDVLKRVQTVTNEFTHALIMYFNGDKLRVSSLETEKGTGNEEVDIVDMKGDSIEIIFNAKQVLEIVNNIDSENIIIKIKESRQPVVILPEEDYYKYLLVPLSIERMQ